MNRNKLKEIYDELCRGEDEIKQKLQRNIGFHGNYDKYGIFSKSWVQKYKNYLKNYLDNKYSKFSFNIKELDPKTEERIFCLINKNYSYNFISNFVLVTSDFVTMISTYFNFYDQQILESLLYDIIIGGNCIIRKDSKNDLDHYITLLYDENKNNSVDFALIFKNRKMMEESLDFILKNNFIIYCELINYSNELNKEIKDFDTNKIIEGYIFRNCEEKQGQIFLGMKDVACSHEKKDINMTNKNIAKINENNNSNINKIKNINNNINKVNNVNNYSNRMPNAKVMNYMNNNMNNILFLINE